MPPDNASPTGSTAPPAAARTAGRCELLLVTGIVLLGLVLRGLRWDAMAVEHFDEGVYASNLYCGHLDPPFAYPMRHLYAPPLFPAILEWAQILAGASAVMWVNVLLGSLTVIATWYATRCWFGRSAAIAAAMLAATSEYHIAFSRGALTDVPLSLLMLLGVFASWRAILSGRPLWIVAAGVLAGLAWCTKYNGWLTLAVTGSGTLAAFLVPPLLTHLVPKLPLRAGRSRDTDNRERIANCELQIANLEIGAAIVRWGLTAAMAGVIFWVFVVRDLAPLGGYAAVAKNHAGYFIGLGGWWSGLLRQAGAHDWLMGWPTCVGIAAAWLACAWIAPRPDGERSHSIARGCIFLVGIVLAIYARLATPSALLGVAALAGFVCVLRRADAREVGALSDEPGGAQPAAWMLLAWFFGLLVAVPLYYPYPRLSLPWVVAAWPLAGAATAAMAVKLVGAQADPATDSRRTAMAALLLAVALGAPLVILDSFIGPHRWTRGRSACPPAWARRDLLKTLFAPGLLLEIEGAAKNGRARSTDVATVVYVSGDPAAFHQLSATCRTPGVVFWPIASIEGLRPTPGVPTFLVTHHPAGSPAPDLPEFDSRQRIQYWPSDLVLLDRVSAGELGRLDPDLPDEIRLYRIDSESTN